MTDAELNQWIAERLGWRVKRTVLVDGGFGDRLWYCFAPSGDVIGPGGYEFEQDAWSDAPDWCNDIDLALRLVNASHDELDQRRTARLIAEAWAHQTMEARE